MTLLLLADVPSKDGLIYTRASIEQMAKQYPNELEVKQLDDGRIGLFTKVGIVELMKLDWTEVNVHSHSGTSSNSIGFTTVKE